MPPFGTQVAGTIDNAADLAGARADPARRPGSHAIQLDMHGQLPTVHFAQVEVAFLAVEVEVLVGSLELDLVLEQAAESVPALQAYEGER
ncbi:hypothetical protein D9M71_727830 [compost metagenome]